MTANPEQRFAIAKGLGEKTRGIVHVAKFFLALLVCLILLVPSFSFPGYAMPEGLVVQPDQGSSYWVLGDLYTIKAVGEQTGQAYGLVEIIVQPHNGTPPHIHSREDEAFYIQEGEVEFQLDKQTIVATAGTFLHSPKGQLHRYTNIGSKPAKMLCWVIPAGLEQFFAQVGVPVTARTTQPPKITPADIEKVTTTAPKYGLEIIPPPGELSK
ncbi:MAG TPA: cupin domain-containing protein [Waterburya sp.]|jgi:quercetin dioxygenase-like cupin family protein